MTLVLFLRLLRLCGLWGLGHVLLDVNGCSLDYDGQGIKQQAKEDFSESRTEEMSSPYKNRNQNRYCTEDDEKNRDTLLESRQMIIGNPS